MTSAGHIEPRERHLGIGGDWTLAHYATLRQQVDRVVSSQPAGQQQLDLSQLGGLDTAGAALLAELMGADQLQHLAQSSPHLSSERRALLETVAKAMASASPAEATPAPTIRSQLAELGYTVVGYWNQQRLLVGFTGQVLSTMALILPRPRRWRITSLVAHIQQTGLNALPIVALLTFMVGAVVAFLGATVLRDFGATIYTVSLVAFAFLREFGVLLAAILLAGRTASAFTAQLGSMKANEEIDALRTLGLDPIELLVVPRVLSLMVTLPILTFVGMLSGILGGSLVCLVALDISTAQILAILQRDVAVIHFFVGLGKAPVFAFVIAVIGCLEGFKAGGSAQSVGERTTSSVVQSIFMVILLDAIAALFFMEMGW